MSSSKRPIPFRQVLSWRIEGAFRNLLESKHLYQSIQIDTSREDVPTFSEATGISKAALLHEWASLHNGMWLLTDPLRPDDPQLAFALSKYVQFRPPDIKLFCTTCDRVEAFNLTTCEDFMARGRAINEPVQSQQSVVQVFVLSYLCQSCKSVPEVFTVRREGLKVTLSGRTPIEHVDVHKAIPKSIAKFFSGAIVAHQSGQTLAANFLMRTLIEQFAYLQSAKSKTAEDAIEKYMDNLPEDFKSRFPSFRDMYAILSEDIHTAKGSPKVFDETKSNLVKHFEARLLVELT